MIVVSGESEEATNLIENLLKSMVAKLVEDESWPIIRIEVMEPNLAKMLSNSTRSEARIGEYSTLLCEAISIARCVQVLHFSFFQHCFLYDIIYILFNLF